MTIELLPTRDGYKYSATGRYQQCYQ
ncbi:hypothetical protein C5167_044058 [Papaver somniferum]|uniref:Uncharacterized protein n=1 Tax=Papaver somniferum TaxID=3469 RepID=A0A4Y7L8F7_PAPSO|nr:hypothetical protein C5167_044058 [Papaver somniferum]